MILRGEIVGCGAFHGSLAGLALSTSRRGEAGCLFRL
jgi:hypothetical protein